MSATQWLALVALGAAMLFVPLSLIWLWRDMRERQRPLWLRLLVVLTAFPTCLGIMAWVVDVKMHPHDPALTRRQVAFQRFGGNAA
jgi:hypothetical protein